MSSSTKRSVLDYLLDITEILIIGSTVFLLVYLFVGQLLEVTGESMSPTLMDREQVLAEKLSTRFKPLQRGEIIIFRHPDQHSRLLIKRVIGLPKENFKLSQGQIFINGALLTEYYLLANTQTTGSKMIIEDQEYSLSNTSYILLGDNREKSSDSRSFGPIREELIVGRAVLVYFPFNHIRLIEH